jgi:hypothetical protein
MTRNDTEKLLVEDVLAGRVSRRTLLKRAAILGVSAPVVASLIAACGEDDDDGVDEEAPREAMEPLHALRWHRLVSRTHRRFGALRTTTLATRQGAARPGDSAP